MRRVTDEREKGSAIEGWWRDAEDGCRGGMEEGSERKIGRLIRHSGLVTYSLLTDWRFGVPRLGGGGVECGG